MTKPSRFPVRLGRRLKSLCLAATLLSTCSLLAGSRSPNLLEQIKLQGTLEFLSSNGPATVYEGAEDAAGFEYELIKRFCLRLGVRPIITVRPDTAAILQELQHRPQAIAAGEIVVTAQLATQADFGPAYSNAGTLVISHKGSAPIGSLLGLVGRKILVKAGSPQADFLQAQQKDTPSLQWQALDLDMQDLQERVHTGRADVALIDRASFESYKALYTQAQVDYEIEPHNPIAWGFAKQPDHSLRDAAREFFDELLSNGELARLRDSFTDDPIEPDADVAAFNRDAEQRLPRWEAMLKQVAAETDLDWRTLAAIGYQESHWDAQATSETGVRGFMMLTNAAAKAMDVSNRLDAKQSIQGGAKLLRFLLDRLPTEMPAEDKLPLALVAYNLGSGHLDDARELARKMGKNTNSWADVKTILPLLSKPSVYRNLRHGYARGRGAVAYADTITTNIALLALREQEAERMQLANGASNPIAAPPGDMSPQITNALRDLALANAF